jgi:PBP1b-binding outer membrane lipoprotein LpoB
MHFNERPFGVVYFLRRMEMKTRKSFPVIVLLMVALLLAACAGQTPAPTEAEVVETEAPPAAATEAPEVEETEPPVAPA